MAATAPLWEIPSYEESNQTFELIDEGVYILELTEVGEPQKVAEQWDPSGKKTRAQFTFTVISDLGGDDYFAGTKINTWYTISMNERSNLYPVAKALLGGQIDPAARIGPSMLLNKRMQATIVHDAPNEKGQVWPKLTSPLALRAPRQRNAQQAIDRAIADTFDAEPDNHTDVPF